MSVIDRIRTGDQIATPGDIESTASAIPADYVEVARALLTVDGELVLNLWNSRKQLLALYDAVKAYQPRMNQARAPLAAQRKAINAALAALEL